MDKFDELLKEYFAAKVTYNSTLFECICDEFITLELTECPKNVDPDLFNELQNVLNLYQSYLDAEDKYDSICILHDDDGGTEWEIFENSEYYEKLVADKIKTRNLWRKTLKEFHKKYGKITNSFVIPDWM